MQLVLNIANERSWFVVQRLIVWKCRGEPLKVKGRKRKGGKEGRGKVERKEEERCGKRKRSREGRWDKERREDGGKVG